MSRSRLRLALALLLLELAISLTAAQPEGFLSIDCGYTLTPNYTDSTPYPPEYSRGKVRPVWFADSGYVLGGRAAQVDDNFTNSILQNNGTDLRTLRYFNETTQSKSCYLLPVVAGSFYLLRAGFLYGNYDGLNVLPVFDLALDATPWTTVTITDPGTTVYLENIFFASNASEISVCLIKREGNGHVPFISSLELRQLPNDAYTSAAGNHLHILKRINFGGPTIRYPSDNLDRVWEDWKVAAPELSNLTSLENFNFHSYNPNNSYAPPGVVVEEAITAPNISFSFAAPSTPFNGTFRHFFAEINNSLPFEYRLMTLQLEDFSQTVNLTMMNSSGLLEMVEISFPNIALAGTSVQQILTKDPTSPLDPLWSAMEAFSINPSLAGTNPQDKIALIVLKNETGLTDWVGDPCLPVSWTEIGCSNDIDLQHVILLNLTSKNLSGSIPQSIASLSSLKTLLLNDNQFTGPPPDLSSLISLTTLDLSNNQLSGEFPNWLGRLSNLTELSIENNNIAGTVPADLLCKHGLQFRYGGNPSLINITTVSCGNTTPGSGPGPGSGSGSGPGVGVVVGAVIAAVAVVSLVGGLLFWQWKVKMHRSADCELALIDSHRAEQAEGLDVASVRKVNEIRKMSEAEIREATNNYKTAIADGVFYGKLARENQEIVVKALPELSEQGSTGFADTVPALSDLQHKNIISLVGFCLEGDPIKNMLVYEYMEGRDLHHRLHGPVTEHSSPLSWTDRLNIALDTAAGLDYLHNGGSRQILHLDVKSTSILLNRKLTAKLTNYWSPKLAREESAAGVEDTKEVRGTAGYIDPESVVTSNWTPRSDVYSFGVLLLELLCGRQPFSVCPPYGVSLHIVDWVRQSLQGGDPESLVDSAVGKTYNTLALRRYINLAMRCTNWETNNRPEMPEIVHELQEIIQIDLEHRAA